MPRKSRKFIVGFFIIVVIIVIWIGICMKREYNKDKQLSKTMDEYNTMLVKERLAARSAMGNLYMSAQTVSENLNKIASQYGSSFKFLGADADGLFTKENSFVKLVTEHLKEDVLRFGGDSFTLAKIIEFMASPTDKTNKYLCNYNEDPSMGILVPPRLTNCSDDILNILLTFVDLQEKVQKKIVIQNAEPSSDFKFSKFKYFETAEHITVSNVSLHSNTFKDMENFGALKSLRITKNTKLAGSTAARVNINTLESFAIIEIEEKEAEHFLHSIDVSSASFGLAISDVNLINAETISKLTYLSSLSKLELYGIVFKEVPDFTFIKKIRSLNTLIMLDIFYAYKEKYEENLFSQIKKNVIYLNISQAASKSNTYTEKEKKIIEENKKIGESISPAYVYMNKNLYHDLGISSLKRNENAFINVIFPLLKDNTFANTITYDISFSIDFKKNHLDIVSSTVSNEMDIKFIGYITGLQFPFSSYTDLKSIWLEVHHKNEACEPFMNTFMRSICPYSSSKSIEQLCVKSKNKANIDINAIIECGKLFKGLKTVRIQNINIAREFIRDTNKVGVDGTPQYDMHTSNDGEAIEVEFIRDN